MTKLISAGLITFTMLFSVSVQAQNVDATNPQALVAAIQGLGYRASLGRDSVDDPLITSSANGDDFYIYFYGCEKNIGVRCKSLQYSKGYDLEKGMSIDQVNTWNKENRFVRVYLDEENDPFIELDVNMDLGGVALENFNDTFDWWITLMSNFEGSIGWNDGE